jgi:carbon monoxide dehydrogenase subunit G
MVSIGALAALSASVVTAQDSAEVPVSRGYDMTGFEQVSVVGPHHVVITVGPAFSVRAEGPQQALDDTTVEIEDGRLEIHPVDDERWGRRRLGGDRERGPYWESYPAATFYVTLPRITGAMLAGGGDMHVDRVEDADFSATVAGSGNLDVARLRVENARFTIAGSGDLAAHGSARHSRVAIAGSGNLRATDVSSEEASITVTGSGNVALTVANDAQISIIGGGDVDIAGPARCSVTRMGGGNVRCGGDRVTG